MIALALLAVAHAPASAPYVYVRNGRLVHSSLGVVRGTHDVREPALSPDGKKVVYWRSGEISPVIEVILASGKQRKVAGTNARSPFYSPDGKTIYFTQSLPWELYAVPAQGGKPARVFGAPQGASDLFMPSWSFGNRSILVQDMKYLYWLDAAGSVVRKLPIAQIVADESGITSAMRFADRPGHPDRLVYSIDIPVEKGQPKDWDMSSALFTFDLSTHTLRRLTPPGLYATDPRWTRDGNTILLRSTSGKGVDTLYRISPDGTGLRRLASGGEPGT